MSVTTKYRILRLLPTKLKILCILTFFLGQLGRAQNLKTKEFNPVPDTVLLSNFTVYIPSSYFIVNGDTLPSKEYNWLPSAKGIYFLGDKPRSLSAHYSELSRDLSRSISLRPMSQYGIQATPISADEYLNIRQPERPFSGLNRSGSLSRGISFGSSQNPVLNSNFNLQLSGTLSDNIRIKASIAENSLPVQGNGFSQQLREFDQIFVELESDDFGRVRAGDIQIDPNESLFLRFQKRVTGGLIETSFPVAKGKGTALVSGALARGRFHRNVFFGQEGNQGPYRLSGAQNEAFILIISGSERVYIDGVQMVRGADADYTIDYATGELSFTALRPITRERRISVEFQYTDQNYLRSVVYTDLGFEKKQWKAAISVYSEQDHPSQPIQQELSDEEKQLLSTAGDNWQEVFISTIRPASGFEGEIRYRLTDSLGNDSVLVYSPAADSNSFAASFIDLGNGKGDYRIESALAGGNVYRWIPPINGIKQGRFAPVRRLNAPSQLQVISSRVGRGKEESGLLELEWAVSNQDENRFSNLDKENDIGHALLASWKKKSDKWATQGGYQFTQKSFKTVERIQNIEFARDWNLSQRSSENQHLANVSAARIWNAENSINLKTSGLSAGEDYLGFRPEVSLRLQSKSWFFRGVGSVLYSQDSIAIAQFYRQKSILGRRYSNFTTGIRSEGEQNTRALENQILQDNGYRFFEAELFQQYGDSTEAVFTELSYFQRFDDSVAIETLGRSANVRGFRTRLLVQPKDELMFSAYIQFRDFESKQAGVKNNQSFTSRWQYRQSLWKRSLQLLSYYETGISNEPLRSFSFIKVPDGTGTYLWIDYNNNGLQELNEFEIAVLPGDGQYIRIFTPTQAFVRAGKTSITQSVGFEPLALAKAGEKPFWARWSIQWNYSLDNVNRFEGLNPLNPFYNPTEDSLALSKRSSNRLSFFFNRTQALFGGDYTIKQLNVNQLLVYGPEAALSQSHKLSLRSRPLTEMTLLASAELGVNTNDVPGFINRNYSLDIQEYVLTVAWQFGEKIRLQSNSSLGEKQNAIGNLEQLYQFTQGGEVLYSLSGASNLTAGLDYRTNNFIGDPLSPVGFEMLQGLQNGDNFLWKFYWERNLFEFLQLNIRYDGRISPGNPAVHLASMQVKAVF